MDVIGSRGKLNRRGVETRRKLIDEAVQSLAYGGPEAVSANLIARKAGVTWGTIQHQFGDADGLWAAVIDKLNEIAEGALPPRPNPDASIKQRVESVFDMLWNANEGPQGRAIWKLRTVLPVDRDALAKEFPATAAAISRYDATWKNYVEELFDGIHASSLKRNRVRSLLPAAVRGIRIQAEIGSLIEVDEARRGMQDALIAYLSD